MNTLVIYELCAKFWNISLWVFESWVPKEVNLLYYSKMPCIMLESVDHVN
jgi:hypothetical protein